MFKIKLQSICHLKTSDQLNYIFYSVPLVILKKTANDKCMLGLTVILIWQQRRMSLKYLLRRLKLKGKYHKIRIRCELATLSWKDNLVNSFYSQLKLIFCSNKFSTSSALLSLTKLYIKILAENVNFRLRFIIITNLKSTRS